MASNPEQQAAVTARSKKQADIKASFKEIQGSVAIQALLNKLDTLYDSELSAAQVLDTDPKAVTALQRANAYGTIRSYIRSHFE